MSLLDGLTKSLVEVYSKHLSEQEQRELIQCLEVLADDLKYNKFQNFFPDEGEYRRELYPRHLDFFKAGALYTERGFIAGNRCFTPWSYLETPAGKIRSLEVMVSKDNNVLSWDGDKECISQASHGILKGIEQAFRLVTDTGEFFDVTAKHRVLTESGWMSVDQLVSLSSGLHLTETREDYQASCVEDGYLCDQQLHPAKGIDQELTPLQDGVLKHSLIYELQDVVERIHEYIHASQLPVHLSTLDDLDRYEGLFELFRAAKTDRYVLPLSCRIQEVHQLLSELASCFQSYLEQQFDQYATDAYHDLLHSCILSSPYNSAKLQEVTKAFGLFCHNHNLDRGDLKSLHGASRISKFYPLYHPPLIGGKRIVSVVPLGLQPIIDVSVDITKNFKAAGFYNHNTGKSEAGCYETVCHATGLYPDWWEGLRFNRPILIWVGGDTATTLRDIVQKKLMGDITDIGSGMLPKDCIVEYKTRRNVPDAIETIRVKHATGGVSTIVLKSYEQGRVTWQGSEVDFIWIDEEAPMDVYNEALIRLMTTKGSAIMTFTPLSGLTDVVLSFLDNSQETDAKFPKWVTVCAWKDVPHISEEMKQKMLDATPPQLREARSEGKPTVGSGLIYPIDQKAIVVDDFPIPNHYMKLYGFDVGWNNTAACWGAWDKDNDIVYIYSEYKRGGEEGLDMPLVHASTIKARGEWIKGAIDPASRGRTQTDGEQLYMTYRKHGLKIFPATNAVEAGIYAVWERLNSGRLKIFRSCTGLLREIGLYHRDEKGKIAKVNDHLLDAMRYMVMADHHMWSYRQTAKDNRKVVDISSYMKACV